MLVLKQAHRKAIGCCGLHWPAHRLPINALHHNAQGKESPLLELYRASVV
jgi:hypothetical protein